MATITAAKKEFVFDGDIVVKDSNGVTRLRVDRETGSLVVHDAGGAAVLRFEALGNNLRFGGHGRDGDLVLFPGSARDIGNLDQAVFHVDGQSGQVRLGGGGIAGRLLCRTPDGKQVILLDGDGGRVVAGGNGKAGEVFVQTEGNDAVIAFKAATPEGSDSISGIRIGGRGHTGRIALHPPEARNLNARSSGTIELDGAAGVVRLGLASTPSNLAPQQHDSFANVLLNGRDAEIRAGGRGANGSLFLLGEQASTTRQASIHLDGASGDILAGGNGSDGDILLFPQAADPSAGNVSKLATIHLNGETGNIRAGVIHLDGGNGNIRAGGNGSDGDLLLSPSGAAAFDDQGASIHLSAENARIRIGGNGIDGKISVVSKDGMNVVLGGEASDIILGNADCAEDFEIGAGVEARPGDVMCLAPDGTLALSSIPYDHRVAGIVAGAGDQRPGIILGRHGKTKNSMPIALTGRTYCRVDARGHSISAGDLLTTSAIPGVAMKADPRKSCGATVGKALCGLSEGVGLIPVLVALQ